MPTGQWRYGSELPNTFDLSPVFPMRPPFPLKGVKIHWGGTKHLNITMVCNSSKDHSTQTYLCSISGIKILWQGKEKMGG